MRLSDAEWTVMRAVWNRAPASARDVLDEVGEETGWAYTTVKTLLARLVEKGALSEGRQANVNIYEPRITRNEARGSALRSLLDRAFDGTFGSLFQHLIKEERLSARDVRTLERMLHEIDDDASAPTSTASTAAPTPASASAQPTRAASDAKSRRTRTTAPRTGGRR
jgi:BlaI family transcriptional regulator, penicillinase repressor